MKPKSVLLAILTLSMALLSVSASAHGIWFAERAMQVGLIYGVGADDLDMVKRLPLIKSHSGYDSDLNEIETELMAAGPIVLSVSDDIPTVYTAVMNNGVWSKTPDGKWHKKGKDEVPDAVIAERTMKYAVHLHDKLTAPLKPLANQTLQIIPSTYPLPEMMGDILQFQVLFEGKPAAGAKIKADFVNDPDAPYIFTNEEGFASVRIRNQGLNVIAAVFDGPADDPKKVNKIEHLATLSFVLEHLPE